MSWSWLSSLLESCSGIVPYPILIRSNQWGVHFWLGLGPKLLWRRPVIYLPLIEEVHVVPAHQQNSQVTGQTVTLRDGLELTITTEYLYRVYDPLLLMTECDDYYPAVLDYHTAVAVSDTLNDVTRDELLGQEYSDSLHEALAERFDTLGAELLEVKIIKMARSRTLNHTGITV